MALGGVATGSINAQLAQMAAGIINKTGSWPAARAPAASMGISNAVVAVLLVISVFYTRVGLIPRHLILTELYGINL